MSGALSHPPVSSAREEVEQLAGDPPAARPSWATSARKVRPAEYSVVGERLQRGPGRRRAYVEQARGGRHIQVGGA